MRSGLHAKIALKVQFVASRRCPSGIKSHLNCGRQCICAMSHATSALLLCHMDWAAGQHVATTAQASKVLKGSAVMAQCLQANTSAHLSATAAADIED